MIRTWEKYRNQNYKNYSDCQVVTAVNAYYYLTGKQYCKNDDEYDIICRDLSCHNGAAIGIDGLHKKMGLKTLGKFQYSWDFNGTWVSPGKVAKIPLPMEINVWHIDTGYHSILVVDHDTKCNAYRVTGFRWETNHYGWIFAEEFASKFVVGTTEPWAYRLLGLKSQKKYMKPPGPNIKGLLPPKPQITTYNRRKYGKQNERKVLAK